MKTSLSILTIAFTLLSTTSQAVVPHGQTLSDASYLRKLSLSLKGVPASKAEYDVLENLADPAKRQSFFDQKIKEYMATPQYRDRMVFRMTELFQVKTPLAPKSLYDSGVLVDPSTGTKPAPAPQDAMTDLFARMATSNLSWDQLLVAKEFNAFKTQSQFNFFQNPQDLGFWALVAPDLPYESAAGGLPLGYEKKPVADKPSYPVKFAPDDLRVAGVLTTARFINRYNTTAVNKNRKRAAAVFKIFLCDSMVPSISTSGDRHGELLDATFPEKFEVTEGEVRQMVAAGADAKHGTDKDCMACHYKLDPLGKVFQNIGVALSPDPAAGALVYARPKDGTMVDIPAKGIGELARAITNQPEYATCQVKWFWKQFIGRDAKLPKKKREELVKAFDGMGRKMNDFVAALVASPDFRTRPPEPLPPEIVTFDRVEPLLQKCDACHALEAMPEFATLPIGFAGTQQEHEEWTAKMIKHMDLPVGDKKKMPKASAGWPANEVELVRKWLGQGARDEFGKQTAPGGLP